MRRGEEKEEGESWIRKLHAVGCGPSFRVIGRFECNILVVSFPSMGDRTNTWPLPVGPHRGGTG